MGMQYSIHNSVLSSLRRTTRAAPTLLRLPVPQEVFDICQAPIAFGELALQFLIVCVISRALRSALYVVQVLVFILMHCRVLRTLQEQYIPLQFPGLRKNRAGCIYERQPTILRSWQQRLPSLGLLGHIRSEGVLVPRSINRKPYAFKRHCSTELNDQGVLRI